MTTLISTSRRYRRIAAMALLLMPLASGAQQQQDTKPVLLRTKFTVGDVTRYETTTHLSISVPLPGQATPLDQVFAMRSLQKMAVVKALPNGGSEVVTTTTSQESTINGQPGPEQSTPEITTDYDAQGNLLSVSGLPESNPMMGPMSSLFSGGPSSMVHLPNHPIAPGDSWTQPLKLPGITGTGTVKSTFVRKEKVGRFLTARIHSVTTFPVHMQMGANNQPTDDPTQAIMSAEGTGTFTSDMNQAIVAGKMVRMGTSGTMVISMTPKGSMLKNSSQTAPPMVLKMTMKINMGINMVQ